MAIKGDMRKKFYVLSNTASQIGFSGEKLGGSFEFKNSCKVCGTGAMLVGNLPVKGIKIGKDFIQTQSYDYLISNRTIDSFKEEKIRVNNLLPIVDYKTNKELPYFHLKSEISFPKMLPESEGIELEGQCSTCKQNGYFGVGFPVYIPYKFVYSNIKEDLLTQSDIFHTWEHFGLSNIKAEGNKVIRYARPLLIVSEKIKVIFERLKIENARFNEIEIKD